MYLIKRRGHTYVYDVDYGEELSVARIVVRGDVQGDEGLFLVKQDGSIEPGDDLPGFGVNAASADGIWPNPPREAIRDAADIACAKQQIH